MLTLHPSQVSWRYGGNELLRPRRSVLSVCHVSQCTYKLNAMLGSCDKNSNVIVGRKIM